MKVLTTGLLIIGLLSGCATHKPAPPAPVPVSAKTPAPVDEIGSRLTALRDVLKGYHFANGQIVPR